MESTIRNKVLKYLNAAWIGLCIVLIPLQGYALVVSFIIGDAYIHRSGTRVQPEVNQQVKSGDIIVTLKGGMIVLAYKDGSQINVQENSKIKIGSANVKGSESVSIIAGVVNGKFNKLLKGSERKVYTPTTVCSVRGTDFQIGVSNSADSRVVLKSGKLAVRNPYGSVNLNEKENADIGVADSPKKSDDVSLNQWKTQKDSEVVSDPVNHGDKMKSYLQKFKERSSKASTDINQFDKQLQKGSMLTKKRLEESCEDIEAVDNEVEEDMLLNEATNSSIEGILLRFQKDKQDIYNIFLRIKEESNRVLEQQRKNYEAIRAVKEAYRKAYEEIMGKHRDYMKQLREKFKKDQVKPQR